MEQIWRIWITAGYGAFEYIGEAAGESFSDACRAFAENDPRFASDFNPRLMTLRGSPLVPLDKRIDGQSIQFGGDRDALASGDGPCVVEGAKRPGPSPSA